MSSYESVQRKCIIILHFTKSAMILVLTPSGSCFLQRQVMCKGHKSSSVKGLCGIRSNQSAYVYFIISQLVPSLMVLVPQRSPNWTANDPKTGNDPQRLYRKRWYLRRKSELADERNEWIQEFGQGIYFIHFFSSKLPTANLNATGAISSISKMYSMETV